METAGRLRLADVFVSIEDPRQTAKVKHDLVELLVVAVNAVLVGADTFTEIELWAEEKLEWLQGYLRLPHGIPSHDTFGRIFGLIDPEQFESAFRRWVSSILPTLGTEIVAIDGKTSRRSGGIDATALHLVSAFAGGADRQQNNPGTAPVYQQSGSRRRTHQSGHPFPLGSREPIALGHGCVLQRRSDARPYQSSRAQSRRPQAHHPQSDPNRSGQTKRKYQDTKNHRRHLRPLPRRTPRTQMMFMQLPC